MAPAAAIRNQPTALVPKLQARSPQPQTPRTETREANSLSRRPAVFVSGFAAGSDTERDARSSVLIAATAVDAADEIRRQTTVEQKNVCLNGGGEGQVALRQASARGKVSTSRGRA